MIKLSELFVVRYGHSLELNRLTRARPGDGVPFVSRSMRRNGVAAYVQRLPTVEPNPAGELTCALSGSVLATFVQNRPSYTAFHVACLRPKRELTLAQKLYYCACIRSNQFRYGYGRQANRTLKDLPIPALEEVPPWLNDPALLPAEIAGGVAAEIERLELSGPCGEQSGHEWKTVSDLFEIEYGNSYELCNLERDPLGVNFVSRRTGNNGVSARVTRTQDEPFPAGCLTVALSGQGGSLQTCVQPAPFYTGFHVAVLTPKQPMPLAVKLFYALALTLNRFRYGFGRQANRTLPAIRLPPVPSWAGQAAILSVQQELAREIRGVFATT